MGRTRKTPTKGTKVKFATGTRAQFEALESTSESSRESGAEVELVKVTPATKTVLSESATKDTSTEQLTCEVITNINIPIPEVPTVTYTIQEGDTIETIACTQSVPVVKLKYLNPGIEMIPGNTLIIR